MFNGYTYSYNNGERERRVKISLKRGQYVRSNMEFSGDVSIGEVLKFLNYDEFVGGYAFKNKEGKKIILQDDTMFSTFPLKESIRQLIDMALSLNDKEWFDELVYIFNHEAESSK